MLKKSTMVRPIDCGSGNTQHAPRVHFSPVVSQLRYREQHGCLRPIKTTKISDHPHASSSTNNESYNYCQQSGASDSDQRGAHESKNRSNESCERVMVHVQEIIVPAPPPVQKVQMQKIQVTVPSHDGSGSDRYALEVNVPTQMSSSSSSSSSSSTAPFQIMDHPPVKINVEDEDPSTRATTRATSTTSDADGSTTCGGTHKNNKQQFFTVLGNSGSGSGGSCGSAPTYVLPHSNSNFVRVGDHLHLSMNNAHNNGHVVGLGRNTKNGVFANAINKRSESVNDNSNGNGYGKYCYGLPEEFEWQNTQLMQRNTTTTTTTLYSGQQRVNQDRPDINNTIVTDNNSCLCSTMPIPQLPLQLSQQPQLPQHGHNPNITFSMGGMSEVHKHNNGLNSARNDTVCGSNETIPTPARRHSNISNKSHKLESCTSEKEKDIWSSKNNNLNKICDRESDGKVKKTFMKSKLSFLQKITLGKLGSQSKSKSKSSSSIISNSKGTAVTGTISKSKTSASSQVVPVSSWPVKYITEVIVVDSRESPPVNKSCSACACSDLCQFKKNSLQARNPTVLRKDLAAGTEVHTGARVYHNLDPVNNRGSRSVDSIPMTVVSYTTASNNPWLSKTNEEEGTGRAINYAVAFSNDIDVSLGKRNIPFTDNWDPQTADQSHFDRVRNVKEASVIPTSHLNVLSSPSDYQDTREKTISVVEHLRDHSNSVVTGEVNAVVPGPNIQHGCTLQNKNVATSPIHHLSTFYALNLPIVPPRFTSTSSSFSLPASSHFEIGTETENNTSNSLLPAPVPKPRYKKNLRRKTSLDSTSDTDELSANVDRILDEIAGLELECLKMEMNGNFFDSESRQDGPSNENKREPKPRLANSQSTVVDAERKRMGLRNHETVVPFGKPPLPPSAKNVTAIRQQFFNNSNSDREEEILGMDGKPSLSEADLDLKLLKFRQQLYRSREELAKSHPNLEEIEDTVRSSLVIDRSRRQRTLPLSLCRGNESPDILSDYTTTHDSEQIHPLTPDPVTTEKERCRAKEWSSLCRQISENYLRSPPSNSNCHGNLPDPFNIRGIVETDLDTGASREIIGGRNNDKQLLLESYSEQQEHYEWHENDDDVRLPETRSKNLPLSIFPDDGRLSFSLNQKTQSMLNLGSPTSTMSHSKKSATLTSASNTGTTETTTLSVAATSDERARSMEFLLDDSDKNAHLRPPENNLMMRQENRQLSEHELRIQRSLNKLNVPDWYKKNASSSSGSASGSNKAKEFGSGTGLAGGWSGLSSAKTSSLTSLQSTGRYSGRSHFSRLRSSGTASSGARSSRESLMSPSSTASASPSPYYERSSFTYGMPYALTRFASARMSCGASPASLSPSPSPVGGAGGSSTSTPVSSAPLSRHHSYSKAPYLGWRSQERLTSKTLYRSPAERLAADLLAQKTKGLSSSAATPEEVNATPEVILEKSPKKETASSDLSLNNSEESNSHKLNRVRSSIKEVSNAIVDYVNESKPLDDGVNGGTSPRKGFVWLESSFVGTKPLDSPRTPDTPSVIMTSSRHPSAYDSGSSSSVGRPKNVFRFDDQMESTRKEHVTGRSSVSTVPGNRSTSSTNDSSLVNTANGSTTTYTPYHSRNEQMEERSNSSSVSSPTLEDILDSLLALRRPNKKIRARTGKGHSRDPPPLPPPRLDPTPISDWQERMNQPLQDIVYFPVTDDFFPTSTIVTSTSTSANSSSRANNYVSDSYDINSLTYHYKDTSELEGEGSSDPVPVAVGLGDSASRDPSLSNHEEQSVIEMIDNDNVPTEDNPESSTAFELEESDLSHRSHQRHVASHHVGQDEVDKEENAFGIPTEIYTTASSGSAVNVITSLNDSNPPTPARHRRVSFDLDISDKEEKSSSRSRRDESVGTILCRNSKCGRNATGLEARREFKTCHNCNAYYCSRECRRAHWEKHKKVCMQSRVGALCKQIINHVKEDSFVVSQLSAVARRGILAKGRGCVKLFFSSPDRAERFLTGGLPELPEPWYIPCGDILPEEMGAQTFTELSDQCRTYSGENRFVLYVSVCVVNEVPTSGAVKWEREMISRSAKLRLLMPRNYEETQMHHQAATSAHLFPDEPSHLSQAHQQESDLNNSGAQENLPPPPPPHATSTSTITSATSESDTLILRSVPVPTTHQLSGRERRTLREVSFANIQKHLVERGVDLRGTYPDIYSKLCNYVENDEPFLPVTIYPYNTITGRQFVCVIMPETPESDLALEDYIGPMGTENRHVETINVADYTVNYDNYSLR